MSRDTFAKWEGWIRTGHGNLVREGIFNLPKTLPRDQVAVVANFARRVSLYETAIAYLNPIVRGKLTKISPPTPIEIAEYAASLSYIGAQEEAKNLLSALNPKEFPTVFLFQSYILFSKWDYEGALTPLNAFFESDVSPYERLIGRINHAAAQVHERHYEEAILELDTLNKELEKGEYKLLQANHFELLAQCYIAEKRFNEARKCLDRAEVLVEQCDNLDRFYIHKWRVIADFLENPKQIEKLRDVQTKAIERSHFETVRQVESLLATMRKDEQALWKVYFGTPFPRFREKLLKDYGWSGEIPKSYLWNLSAQLSLKQISREELHKGKGFKKGQLLDRLFQTLTRDFYRPARVGYLHQLAFPGEYYNPESTPAKVHESIRRLRSYFEDAQVEIKIQFLEAGYQLSSQSHCSILVEPPSVGPQSAVEESLNQLLRLTPESPFSLSDVIKVMKISERSAARLMKEATDRGYIVKERKGRNTFFHKKCRTL